MVRVRCAGQLRAYNTLRRSKSKPEGIDYNRTSTAEAYVLRTHPRGGDLDGYVFGDEQHARNWMSQRYVEENPEAYELQKCLVKWIPPRSGRFEILEVLDPDPLK